VSPYVFVLAALAAYRLARFVVHDSLLEDARRWVFRRFPPDQVWVQGFQAEHQRTRPHKLGQLLDCTYCLGFWISGLVLVAAYALGHVPAVTDNDSGYATFVALWWALAGAQALLNAIDHRLTR
jgi:hypothetical protein